MSGAGTTYAALRGPAAGPVLPGAVVLVAQAGYHLDDLLPLADELERQGRPAVIVCPLPAPSVLRRWRSSWWRHRELLAAAAARGLGPSAPIDRAELVARAAAVAVRNDWGVPRPLVEAARAAHVPTIGWVEGVQDFADVDTGRARHAYRSVDHVLSLGAYDAAQLAGADVTPVGSQRLWAAWHGPPTTGVGPIVANVNFTYGVLEHARRPWVDDVLAAAQGHELVLSRHPADRGRHGRRFESKRPVEELLRAAPRLVTRFSTLAYEALALGVELVYHNPHGERVATFADPQGAFTVTATRAELAATLGRPRPEPPDVRARAGAFLANHLVLEDPPPAARAARAIAERLG